MTTPLEAGGNWLQTAIDSGKLAPGVVDRGAYASGTAYSPGQRVTSGGQFFINQVASTGVAPTASTTTTTWLFNGPVTGGSGTNTVDAPFFNLFFPEAHGAVGDGVTNDTAAITAADAAAAASGGRVLLTKTYVAVGLSPSNGVTWDGPGTLLKPPGTTGQHVISMQSKSNVKLKGFTVDGNHANGCTGRGIWMNTCVAVRITDGVTVKNAGDDGGVMFTSCTDCSLEHSTVDSCYDWNVYVYAGIRVKILNNNITNAKTGTNTAGQSGMGVSVYSDSNWCEVRDNTITGCQTRGISVNAGQASADCIGNVIAGNVVTNSGNLGIFATNDSGTNQIGGPWYQRGLQVYGNRSSNNGDKNLYLFQVQDATCFGNTATGSPTDGICYESCTNLRSAFNVASGNQNGLRITGTNGTPSTVESIHDDVANNTNPYAPNTLTAGSKIIRTGTTSRSIATSTTQATTGTSTTTAVTLATLALPTSVVANDIVEFEAMGDLLNNSAGAVTYNFTVKIGTATVLTTGTAPSMGANASRRWWRLSGRIVLAATNDQRVFGRLEIDNPGSSTLGGSSNVTYVGRGTSAVDMTTAQNLTLAVQMGTSDPNADCRLDEAILTTLTSTGS